MRVTSKGQVTIPLHIRRRRRLGPGVEVQFVEKGDDVVLRPASGEGGGEGSEFAEHLDRVTGIVEIGMSTDAFMELLRGE